MRIAPLQGYLYLGHLFTSYSLSLVLTVTLESPFLALDRLITKAYHDCCDPLGHHLSAKRNAAIATTSSGNFNGSSRFKGNSVYIENHIDAMLAAPKNNNKSNTMRGGNRSDRRPDNGKVNMAFDNAKL